MAHAHTPPAAHARIPHVPLQSHPPLPCAGLTQGCCPPPFSVLGSLLLPLPVQGSSPLGRAGRMTASPGSLPAWPRLPLWVCEGPTDKEAAVGGSDTRSSSSRSSGEHTSEVGLSARLPLLGAPRGVCPRCLPLRWRWDILSVSRVGDVCPHPRLHLHVVFSLCARPPPPPPALCIRAPGTLDMGLPAPDDPVFQTPPPESWALGLGQVHGGGGHTILCTTLAQVSVNLHPHTSAWCLSRSMAVTLC